MSAPTRVLCIDDDPSLCRLVKNHLERRGYAVEIATDGVSGLARIAQGGIDIIALDHNMPNLDGLGTLSRVRALADPPPVIYITATLEGPLAFEALKAGASDFVPKDAQGGFLPLLQRSINITLHAVMLRRAKESAEAESKRYSQLIQNIVNTIRDPLVVLEHDMTIATASKAFLTMFGITEAAARGRRISQLGQHQWDLPAFKELMKKVIPENKPIESFEIEDNFPDLGRRVFNLNARKISQPENSFEQILLVFEDITDRKQRERDAAMLTNEISHRIKNNLQVVIGLLVYESASTPAPYVQGYKATQARIGAIAQLYDLISQSSGVGTVALDVYLKEIVKALSASLLGDTSGIKIEVKAGALHIDPDRAVPLGLLVNELVMNAVKHAFPGGTGNITLSVERIEDQIELTVADDGVGMKDRDLAKGPEKRGADYMGIFVRQLGGMIVASKSEGTGTSVRIQFPLLLVSPRGAEPIAA